MIDKAEALVAAEKVLLKEGGSVKDALLTNLDRLVPPSESKVLKDAISHNYHIKMVKDYLGKSAKEIHKGIISYEKQIARHKDKIANPAKHYPNWHDLHPTRKAVLINKKWPSEIKLYKKQKNLLESILKERIDQTYG